MFNLQWSVNGDWTQINKMFRYCCKGYLMARISVRSNDSVKLLGERSVNCTSSGQSIRNELAWLNLLMLFASVDCEKVLKFIEQNCEITKARIKDMTFGVRSQISGKHEVPATHIHVLKLEYKMYISNSKFS